MKASLSLLAFCFAALPSVSAAPQPAAGDGLWTLAKKHAGTHRFSTLLTAQDVQRHLSSEQGLEKALDWCKKIGVTKVYIESFRDGYQPERPALQKAMNTFRAAGFEVSGCITTTRVGKPSTRSKDTISCYTDKSTQERIQAIFEYAAGLSDEVMIDDFWFTDCTCPECDAARKARTVTVGDKSWPVSGDTWEDYRCELMVRVSQQRLLAASKRVNPRVRLIIKYPQWYDRFHERGYEVVRETADFDRIWVGTETRDYEDRRWGGTVQYEGYFIMRWLGGLGGAKCGGGWYDWLGTTERTYVEQARQTVLAGARESMLFCYGGLQGAEKDVNALRTNVPELLNVARAVRKRRPLGVAAYKPANSHPEKEAYVFDGVGMLGFPLVPCHEFPTNAPAAFFSVHALKDAAFASKLTTFIKARKPVLLTDGLVEALTNRVKLDVANVHVLGVKGNPKSLLGCEQPVLDELRAALLRPLKTNFKAPSRVALYLFKDGSYVVENFRDEPVTVELNKAKLTVSGRGWESRF